MKNTLASKAMKAAWTNWKAGRYTSWSKCLKSAWAWVKSLKNTVTVSVTDSYRFTQKAVCIDRVWWPLSQIKCNWTLIADCKAEVLNSIEVPGWLYNKKFA